MSDIITFLKDNQAVIFAGLFGISELLSLLPSVKSNGLFQLIFNMLRKKASK